MIAKKTAVTSAVPRHVSMAQFKVVDGCIQVGGIPITQLADRIGKTPYYAYDRALLTARVAEMRSALPPEVDLHYAMKANPMPALVCHMSGLVDGIDVASAGELKVALDAGMAPDNISFAGPGKQRNELAQAVAAGVLLNVESFREARELAEISQRLGMPARVAVRVNPDFELKMSGMKMGGGPKQFGVDSESVPELLREMRALGVAFEGFHIYSGSQNLAAESICEAQQKSVELAIRLSDAAPMEIRVLNIGGGFGIPYFPGDERLNLTSIGENLRELVTRTKRSMPKATLIVELGRYLVGEAGIYVCRVIDRKESRGKVFLIVDGGLHHHLAASGNFGQVIRKNYPVVNGNKLDACQREVASIVGPLCTPLDIVADGMELSQTEVGDLIVVFQSGAYGLTASPNKFLSQPDCAEILV